MTKPHRRSRGFTMIELLVVIAVIGILAVALLATLNPLEQIRKGRDTRTRSDASQLASAIERYNASLGWFPWQEEEGQDLIPTSADVPFLQINGAGVVLTGCTFGATPCTIVEALETLEDTNEVKSSFISRITDTDYSDMYLYFNDQSTGSSPIVCFTPESNTFSREAFGRCRTGNWGVEFLMVFSTTVDAPCPDFNTQADYLAGPDFDATGADEMICLP